MNGQLASVGASSSNNNNGENENENNDDERREHIINATAANNNKVVAIVQRWPDSERTQPNWRAGSLTGWLAAGSTANKLDEVGANSLGTLSDELVGQAASRESNFYTICVCVSFAAASAGCRGLVSWPPTSLLAAGWSAGRPRAPSAERRARRTRGGGQLVHWPAGARRPADGRARWLGGSIATSSSSCLSFG